MDVFVLDKYAYVAFGYEGLHIVDVYDIKNVASITSSGNNAFAADYHLGLVQLNISEITKPVLANTFDTGKTNDVCIYEDYIYAMGEKGISVFAIE